jgi:hypothetical protein
MTTATAKKTTTRAVKKSPPMRKENVAASNALAAMGGERPTEDGRPAGGTIEHDHAAWKAAVPPEVLSQYWEKQFAELSEAHTECASQIRGARGKLYDLLVMLAAIKEKYDNPPAKPAVNFNSTVERVIRSKLGGLGLLPKNPNYSDLIISAAIHPAEKLPDAEADKARREAIQKKCHTYKKVFQEAAKANITSANMLPWLEENGIEAIRLGRWKTKEQREKEKIEADKKAAADDARVTEFATRVRNSSPKFSFPVKSGDIVWNSDKDHHEMVLLATYRPSTNSIDVIEVVKGAPAFNTVIRIASKGGV